MPIPRRRQAIPPLAPSPCVPGLRGAKGECAAPGRVRGPFAPEPLHLHGPHLLARRAAFHPVEFAYKRPFEDQWGFVEYAMKNQPELDLLTPPNRPESKPRVRGSIAAIAE
jgi:hypothetical protein